MIGVVVGSPHSGLDLEIVQRPEPIRVEQLSDLLAVDMMSIDTNLDIRMGPQEFRKAAKIVVGKCTAPLN